MAQDILSYFATQ